VVWRVALSAAEPSTDSRGARLNSASLSRITEGSQRR